MVEEAPKSHLFPKLPEVSKTEKASPFGVPTETKSPFASFAPSSSSSDTKASPFGIIPNKDFRSPFGAPEPKVDEAKTKSPEPKVDVVKSPEPKVDFAKTPVPDFSFTKSAAIKSPFGKSDSDSKDETKKEEKKDEKKEEKQEEKKDEKKEEKKAEDTPAVNFFANTGDKAFASVQSTFNFGSMPPLPASSTFGAPSISFGASPTFGSKTTESTEETAPPKKRKDTVLLISLLFVIHIITSSLGS